jgi:PKD repeat protein
MNRSRIATGVLITLLLASPLLVSAQSASGTPPGIAQLIALYTQLIQILEQEIAQLQGGSGCQTPGCPVPVPAPYGGPLPIAACPFYTFPDCTTGTYIPQATDANGCTVPGHYNCTLNASLTASPTSGTAPLAVTFTGITPVPYSNYSINFGDGQSSGSLYSLSDPGVAGGEVTTSHTYQTAGTYASTLSDPSGDMLGTATITVSGGHVTGCPVYTFPACTTGTYIPQATDANGCTVPGHYQCTPNTTFKSTPTVAQVQLPSTTLVAGTNVLTRFSVTAAPSGTIGLAKVRFPVTVNGASLSNYVLYAYNDAAYSVPVNGTIGDSLGTPTITTFPGGSTGAGFQFAQPLEIPAGSTYYFQLVGVASSLQSAASVSTTLASVGTVPSPVLQPAPNFAYGFIWSPNSTTTSSYSTNDWTNGSQVPSLPSAGLTQTITVSGLTACPMYEFPYCPSGTYVPQSTDANGCAIPGHYQCTPSSFGASPTSGQAPLTVTFSGVDSGMNFGDGSLEQASDNQTIGPISHTYTTAGTYSATDGSQHVTITVN